MRRSLLIVTLLVCLPAGASAQEWRASGSGAGARAFFTQNGRAAGIELACRPSGRLRITAAGNGARFPSDRDVTLVLSVDGTAFALRARVEDEPSGGGSRFVREDTATTQRALVSALKAGRNLEVSSPAGFLRLPLAGSGKALATLEGGCPGS